MKKRYLIPIIIIFIFILIAIGIHFFSNKKNKDDINTLYKTQFGDTKIKFERYDYSLGQNQIVGVEKSENKGKTYKKLTKEPIIVSMDPKFIFINKKLGFAISKPNLSKSNNYMGVKVTQDGGKTFIDGKINYNNPNIDILTVEDVPYMEDNLLFLPCSIYQVNKDNSGYENVKLIFISDDDGLTWNLKNKQNDISFTVITDTITGKGATFIMRNNSNKRFYYGPEYIIEKKENDNWKEVKNITGKPLSWNAIAYNLKENGINEINIDWSYGYGELDKGTYRLVKHIFKEEDRPINESKIISTYAEFIIEN